MLEQTKPHIVLGTESWLSGDILSSEVFPSNFSVIRKDRDKVINRDVFGPMKDNSSHGGVFVAVAKELTVVEVPELDVDAEIVWAKLVIPDCKALYVGAFYRQPRTNIEYLDLLDSSLSHLNTRDSDIIIGGDFNLPDVNWNTGVVDVTSSRAALHHRFMEIIADHGLEQLVRRPTFEANTLDLLLTNRPSAIARTELLPGICRHHGILSEAMLHPHRVNEKPRRVLLHRKADICSLKSDMSQLVDNLLHDVHGKTCEMLWDEFRTGFQSVVNKNVPSKIIRCNKNLPWISSVERKLIRRRKRLYRKCKTESDKVKYRAFDKEVNGQIKKAYFLYLQEILTPSDNDQGWDKQKRWYSFLKQKRRDNGSVSPLKDQGELVSEDKAKAEIFNRQFYSAFTPDDNAPLPPLDLDAHPVMPDLQFHVAGVTKVLKDLKPHKASGPDDIAARYLKETADIIAPALTAIFNKSYDTGVVPGDWKCANVCPIYKKGERYQAANYRPVSLTCITSKVMEHCIVSNILDHMERNELFHPHQHGFRRRLSTETQLVTFIDELANSLSSEDQVDAVILDFSKAFDKVSHRLLLHKLQHYGIKGRTNKWLEAFLSNRSQQVLVNGEASTAKDVISGVPQGSVVGPTLFLCYINDLPLSVTAQVRLFADDAIIYRKVKCNTDGDCLQ